MAIGIFIGNTIGNKSMSPYWTTLNTLSFIKSANNPTTPGASESEIIMADDGITCDQWWKHQENDQPTIHHRTANNALLDNWSESVECTGVSGYFPTVFKIGTDYYMFIKQSAWDVGDIYLYHSTDKIAWTVMNGGDPVIVHSSDTSSWYNKLYNVSVVVIGTTVHILCDGSEETPSFPNPYSSGYASADISNPVFTLQATPTILNGSNADLKYSSKHNALVLTYNKFAASALTVPKSSMVMAFGKLTDDLTLEASWIKSTLTFPSLNDAVVNPVDYPSDFSICFTPGKTYPMMMYYCWTQVTGHQAYANVRNSNELLESTLVPYSLVIASATRNKIDITFNYTLDNSVPAASAFTVTGKTVTNVAIVGGVVTLTVSVPFVFGDSPKVTYRKPGINPLKATINIGSFKELSVTNNIPEVEDADGNVYTKVTVGSQVWLLENLKTSKYNDGSTIPSGLSNADWTAQDGTAGKDGAFDNPNGDAGNKAVYGLLYNWYAINNAKGVAPAGYRVATAQDYADLITGLGGDTVAGGKMKESGTTHWTAPNQGDGSSGLNLLPAGYKAANGTYALFGLFNILFSATQSDAGNANCVTLSNNALTTTQGTNPKNLGLTVGCIKI